MLADDELFREASWLAVLNGQGINATGHAPVADTLDAAANRKQLEHIAQVVARAGPTLPLHDDVIAELTGRSERELASA